MNGEFGILTFKFVIIILVFIFIQTFSTLCLKTRRVIKIISVVHREALLYKLQLHHKLLNTCITF